MRSKHSPSINRTHDTGGIDRRAAGMATAAALLLACAVGAGNASAQAGIPPAPDPSALLVPGKAPPAAPVVEVRQYLVLGVTLLDAASVEAALAGMTGQRTVEELHRAAGTVQALYARAGYGAVVLYLPPQEVSGGVITLQAIEGRIAAVRVEGSSRDFGAAGIAAGVPALQVGQTPRLDLVDIQLRLANDNPAKRTRLVLLPGRLPEETEAEITVDAAARHQLALELENSGTPATGKARVGVAWRDANLSGRDDVLELRMQTAPDRPRRFSAASVTYRLPVVRFSTMLDAYALVADTQSNQITTSAGDLSFAGRGHLLGLRATRFLARMGSFDPRISLALERRDQRNQCTIGSLPEGACGSAGGDLAITPLLIEFNLAGDVPVPLAMSVALVQGLAWGGGRSGKEAFDAVRPGARPVFTALRGQLSAQQRIDAAGWTASARFAGQWSADPLVPAMQFGAGGRLSVRGYEERELAADHGVALSLELSAPIWSITPWPGGALRPLLFFDAAALRNRDQAPCSGMQTRCNLAGTGVGLRFDAASVSISLDIAHALHDGGSTAAGRTRAHLWLRLIH